MSNSFNTQATSPHELFNAEWYLKQNPDVAQAGVDPFLHYMTHGWREGRDPHPEFDTSFYLEANPDVAAAGENPLVHYCLVGRRKGLPSRSMHDADSHKSVSMQPQHNNVIEPTHDNRNAMNRTKSPALLRLIAARLEI